MEKHGIQSNDDLEKRLGKRFDLKDSMDFILLELGLRAMAPLATPSVM